MARRSGRVPDAVAAAAAARFRSLSRRTPELLGSSEGMFNLAEVIRRLPESPVDELLLPCDRVGASLAEKVARQVAVGDQILGRPASLTQVLRGDFVAILVFSSHVTLLYGD